VSSLLVFQPITEESKDRWLGCWTRIYDADHVAKHEAQDITAIQYLDPEKALGPHPPTRSGIGKFRSRVIGLGHDSRVP